MFGMGKNQEIAALRAEIEARHGLLQSHRQQAQSPHSTFAQICAGAFLR
jgi:hypothetical protein